MVSPDTPMRRGVEISLAPMLDVTTAHFRRFVRLTSEDTVLFTEMIVSSTIVHISREKLVGRLGEWDLKTVVQIGGSDPQEVAEAVRIVQEMGYSRFNLNCGCPSSRVQRGSFGAVLMLRKEVVGEIVNAVHRRTGVVMSLKIRTGVDECDGFEFVDGFVRHIKQNTPCRTFYIHARKCWLRGLSPQQNRNIPPLDYECVYLVKKTHPELNVVLNGSICGGDMTKATGLDGLMIGREAVRNIFVFWEMEQGVGALNGDTGCARCLRRETPSCRDEEEPELGEIDVDGDVGKGSECGRCVRRMVEHDTVRRYFLYFSQEEVVRASHVQPIMNLLAGRNGCKKYRRRLSELVTTRAKARDVYEEIKEFI